jgi:hypothetical protein
MVQKKLKKSKVDCSSASIKTKLWYQILAFFEIAWHDRFGRLAPLVFENSIHTSLASRAGDGDISASAGFITRVTPTPSPQQRPAQRLLSNPPPPSNSVGS